MRRKRATRPSIDRILAEGGAGRIALLRYCVISITMEPIFVFLASEYRLRPTHAGAVALYDVFCAPGGPAPIRAAALLPPHHLGLASGIDTLRRQVRQLHAPQPAAPHDGIPITAPMRGLFDPVVELVRTDPEGRFTRMARRYDASRTPVQNLPGARMTAGQRHFVENVWRPRIRPGLVSAGFWQLTTIE